MLGRVVVENGVKKIVPLTADCGSGNPCGAIITVYQRTVPNGYLPLGAQYDITQFPVLYSILGTDTIPTASALGLPTLTTGQYVIKATSGINENQADNVLSALSPVSAVTSGDMHAVTSNAVAEAFEWELISSDDVTFTIDTAGSSSTAFTPVYRHIYKCKNLIKMALAVTTTEAIPTPVGNGNMRFYVQINGIVPTSNLSTISTIGYINDAVVPISVIYNSSISPNGWRVTFRYNEALDSNVTFGFYAIMAI